MSGMAARHDAATIPAEVPDGSSDGTEPFPGRSGSRPGLRARDVIWTYGELAAVLADASARCDIPPGDGVLIVSGGSAPILAIAESATWSVAMNPRLSAEEVDRLRAHGDPSRAPLHELPDATRRHADIFIVRGSGTRDIGPLDRKTVRNGSGCTCRTPPERSFGPLTRRA
jgi:hypothetical protein